MMSVKEINNECNLGFPLDWAWADIPVVKNYLESLAGGVYGQ